MSPFISSVKVRRDDGSSGLVSIVVLTLMLIGYIFLSAYVKQTRLNEINQGPIAEHINSLNKS